MIQSFFDRVLASRMGVFAADSLLKNKSKTMVGIKSDEIIEVPLSEAEKGARY